MFPELRRPFGGERGVRRAVLRRSFRLEPPPPSESELWGRELASVPLALRGTLGVLATIAAAILQ